MDKPQYNKTNDSSSDVDDKSCADGDNRKCRKCHEWKTSDEFYYRGGKADGICKICKKSAQKDNYRKKTFTQNVDVVLGNILNKILEYKILRVKIVNDELGRLINECETQLQGRKLAAI